MFDSLQAPEDDVEGCILHVDEGQEPHAILCKGRGSYETKLKDIKPSVEENDEFEAATV